MVPVKNDASVPLHFAAVLLVATLLVGMFFGHLFTSERWERAQTTCDGRVIHCTLAGLDDVDCANRYATCLFTKDNQ